MTCAPAFTSILNFSSSFASTLTVFILAMSAPPTVILWLCFLALQCRKGYSSSLQAPGDQPLLPPCRRQEGIKSPLFTRGRRERRNSSKKAVPKSTQEPVIEPDYGTGPGAALAW